MGGRSSRDNWTSPSIELSSSGQGQGGSVPWSERVGPLDQRLERQMWLRCDPAAQLNLPLIEQAAQPLHRCLLSPGEMILLVQQPVDLSLGDHPGSQALKEQFASGHGFVTNWLHADCLADHP